MTRRPFPAALRRAIVARATDGSGHIHCERCGVRCDADYEIDHIIAEALLSDVDKKRPLVLADGQLLCKTACHRKIKTPKDVARMAKLKRIMAKPPLTKIANGPRPIARRYGQA